MTMMKPSDGRRGLRGTGRGDGLPGLLIAALLAVAGLSIGGLCVRVALIGAMPPDAPSLLSIASHDPDVVLGKASDALVRQHGILDRATLNAVRRAATVAPLDARAFLILGHQQMLDGEPRRALATWEAGQRLDPRQRLIHILLLDRYLRTGRYASAATQFSVLARLMGETQASVATAMAQMSLAPETRDAVRRTLATDPWLERAVLVALARSGTPPATIFALASPVARAEAGGSWGPALVARLVEGGRFAAARAVWARVHHLPPATTVAPIFNAGFVSSAASPPFNWMLAAGGMGVAELRQGGLSIDYYGRDSGDLASQLLVLQPGRYRFSFSVEPGKTDAASLIWTIACANGNRAALMNVPVVAAAARRQIVADFAVPANCPAQMLSLRGEAGDYPVPVAVTLRDPAIGSAIGSAPRPPAVPVSEQRS